MKHTSVSKPARPNTTKPISMNRAFRRRIARSNKNSFFCRRAAPRQKAPMGGSKPQAQRGGLPYRRAAPRQKAPKGGSKPQAQRGGPPYARAAPRQKSPIHVSLRVTAGQAVFFGKVTGFVRYPQEPPVPAKTSSAGRADAPILVVQLTDTHLMADPAGVLCHVNTDASLRAVLDLVRANGHRPDLLLATGDLSHDGSPAAYRRLRELLEQTDWPVRCLPGNHDDPQALRDALGQWTQPVTDIGGWRIVLLDSTV